MENLYENYWIHQIIMAVDRVHSDNIPVSFVAKKALIDYRKHVAWKKKRIKFFKEKLQNPINNRTGEPLKPETILSYERNLKHMTELLNGEKAELSFFAAIGFYGPPSKRLRENHSTEIKKVFKADPFIFYFLRNAAESKMKRHAAGGKVICFDRFRMAKKVVERIKKSN